MSMKKEKRIEEVMNSLEGFQKPKVPQNGFRKIQQELADQRQQQPQIKQPSRYGWIKVAAVIALVLCSNIWVVSEYLTSDEGAASEAGGYSQITNDFNLYEYE